MNTEKTNKLFKTISYTLLVISYSIFTIHCFAQDADKERLKKEKARLQEEINYTNEL